VFLLSKLNIPPRAERTAHGGFPEEDLLCYIDLSNYDETPMPIVAKELPTQEELQSFSSSQALCDAAPGVLAIPDLPHESFDKAKQCSKLFQSEQKFVALVRLRKSGSPAGFAVLHGNSTNWLQRLEDTGALCVTAALQRTSAVSEFANCFKHRFREACTDDAKANQATEARLLAQRNSLKQGWNGWRIACEVHKAATCHTIAFMPMEATNSSLVNASLLVNMGSHVGRFRRLVAEVIRANLIFRTTPLDEEAKTHKMHVLRIFCQSGRKRSFRVTMLLRLLPGDWRNRSKVEYILQPGETCEKVTERVARGVSMILTATRFFQWPRHRWTGADVAVSQWGLMEAIHVLLS